MFSVEVNIFGQVSLEESADAGQFLRIDMSIHDANNFLLNEQVVHGLPDTISVFVELSKCVIDEFMFFLNE